MIELTTTQWLWVALLQLSGWLTISLVGFSKTSPRFVRVFWLIFAFLYLPANVIMFIVAIMLLVFRRVFIDE